MTLSDNRGPADKRGPVELPVIMPWFVLAAFTGATALFVVAVDERTPGDRAPQSQSAPQTASSIKHVVVVVQENHSFDSYYGRYCKAAPGSNPTCEKGRDCCEAGPARDPGSGARPITLDDQANRAYDPNHHSDCELLEINGGKMDKFVSNPVCGDPRNFAYATARSADVYWSLADRSALADHYFQPVAGASSSNDMYFARAQFVFADNDVVPDSVGARCGDLPDNRKTYEDPTVGDLLTEAGVSWAFYAEGYQDTIDAQKRGSCPKPNPRCSPGVNAYPCIYDPSDNPFQYYRSSKDTAPTERDYALFSKDLASGHLPAVSFVKGLGFRTEHPGSGLRDGMSFISTVVNAVSKSASSSDTLILIVPDESGGFFDHVAPPTSSDGHPYGARVPLLAVGPFARKGAISHAQLEHSSIVKFIEWNWLGGTGQLHGRDASVSNIGSLLDVAKTGAAVPSD